MGGAKGNTSQGRHLAVQPGPAPPEKPRSGEAGQATAASGTASTAPPSWQGDRAWNLQQQQRAEQSGECRASRRASQ
eukprot:1298789-Alexandrium_andersonii.AAC.1